MWQGKQLLMLLRRQQKQKHQEQQHPPQQQQAALLLLLGLWVVGQSGWSWGKCVAMQQSEMRIG